MAMAIIQGAVLTAGSGQAGRWERERQREVHIHIIVSKCTAAHYHLFAILHTCTYISRTPHAGQGMD